MLIIGLTGSIATGKTSAANHFRDKNIPVFSADDAVHELYRGEAVAAIERLFPGVIVDGQVDRMELSKQLLAHPEDFTRLEALIHPLVADKRRRFIDHQRRQDAKIIVLDIPLLLEKKLQAQVDVILLLTTSAQIQQDRVLRRPGMTMEKLQMIRSRQLGEDEKRQLADYVVDSGGPVEQTRAKLDQFLESLQN